MLTGKSLPEPVVTEGLVRPSNTQLHVKLVMRRPLPGQFSVERVFRDIAAALPTDIDASLVEVPRHSKGVLPRLRNMLFTARLQADVVHVTGDIQYCALTAPRGRCVLTVLDLVSFHRLKGWRQRILFVIWYRLPVRVAPAVTTISGAVRHELLKHFPTAAHKTTVIGCPVNPNFRPAANVPLEESGEFRVLQVGTGPNKNFERVALALKGLPIHFHVVGRLTDKQRHLLENLRLPYSLGTDLSDAEMQLTYQRSTLLVFASTYEGFGLPILEAQACGIPVVTSGLSPMCDIAGEAAIMVDPHDVGSIRHGVTTVLGDAGLRATLRESGLLNAALYSPTRVAAHYAETYRRVGSGNLRNRGTDGTRQRRR